MKQNLLIFATLILQINAFSQDTLTYPRYWRLHYQLHDACAAKDWKTALALTDSLDKLPVTPFPKRYYRSAIACDHAHQPRRAHAYAWQAARAGYSTEGLLKALRKPSASLRDSLAEANRLYQAGIDSPLVRQISRLIAADQYIRTHQTPDFKHESDSIIQIFVDSIFMVGGIPTPNRVGMMAYANCVVMLRHWGDDTSCVRTRQLVLPQLYAGHLTPEDYASLYDRWYSLQGKMRKEDYYGSSLKAWQQQGTPPLTVLNARRDRIGLYPLEQAEGKYTRLWNNHAVVTVYHKN
jgi:hypothetical protein